MSHVNQDDGCTYLEADEHWCVSGYVTIKVHVCFETCGDPGDREFDRALDDAINDVTFADWELVDSDDLEFEVESDGVYD